VIVADIPDRLANQARDVDVGGGRDLARDVDLARDHERFARDSPGGIVAQNRVEHRVRDLIGDLVRVPFGHRF